MKRNLLLLFALGTLLTLGITTSNLMAQGNAPATNQPANPQTKPPIPVVVVDFMYLMEIHPQLHVERNNLDQKLKQAQTKVQGDLVQLQNKQKELSGIAIGTPGYSEKMDEIRKIDSDIKLRAINEEEALQLNDIRINYQAYQEIKNMIDAYARNNNILLVINHLDIARRLPVEKTPQTMDVELSQMQTVICRNPAYDITPAIEKWLNDTYVPKGFAAVNYEQLKEQRFNQRPAGGTQSPTNVAVAPASGPGR